MTRIKSRLLLKSAILGALVCPATLYALGLGEIHLNSALSQPFDAEVELVNPTADEISSLKVGLASSESFTRFGLDRPAYLSNFVFKVTPTGNGRAVVHITSTKSVTEPVVSLLLEVSSASGRQLREYTVFLDPPVFVPSQSVAREEPRSTTPPPVEPARTEGVIERTPQPEATTPPPPPPAVVPPPVTTTPAEPVAEAQPAQPLPTPEPTRPSTQESTPVAPSFAGESYEVKRNESLWKIATRIRPGSPQEINQTMIALYRANPSAFIGNINRLRSGAVLRVPAVEEMQAVDARSATAEVSRQYSEWRPSDSATAPAEDRGHLKLVTPTEPVEAPVTAAADKAKAEKAAAEKAAADKAAAEKAAKAAEAERVAKQREAEAEAKRLLELKNAEMARMQRERDERAAAEKAAAEKAAADKAAADKAAAEKAAAEKAAQPVAEATPPAETPAEQPAAEEKKPTPKPVAPPPEPSFMDSLKDLPWNIILGGLGIVALLVGWVVYSRRRQSSMSSGMQFPMPTATEPTMTPAEFEAALDETPVAPTRSRPRQESFEAEDVPDSLPEAEGTKPLYGGAPPEVAPAKASRSADDTMSSETAVHVDQQDAVAEADFHMAYGLYDQAADLVKIAIGREPKRRDLKLKLLEIFFVWGNKEQFIETARELHETRAQAGAGEWDKILIMGKQIAPEDPLFKGGAVGSSGDMLDVNLEGGENRVDFDLFSTPDGAGAEPSASLDFEIGNTGARAKPQSHLDFLLDDSGNAPLADDDTREMDANARTQETPTIESPALSNFNDATRDPTVEMNFGEHTTEQTAELSIDDLGLDVGSLESTGSLERTTALSGARRENLGDEIADDELTRIAPLSEIPLKGRSASMEPTMEVPAFNPESTQRGKANGHADDEDGDGDVGISTIYLEQMESPNGDVVETLGPRGDETAHMLSPTDLDLDLAQLGETDASDEDTIRGKAARVAGGIEATAEMPAPRGRIADTAATVEHPRPNMGRQETIVATSELPEMEPVTMSEVGTKLDLARAYMDMGDPDGARSILEEVLGEGNSGQRAEAQRLLDSIR